MKCLDEMTDFLDYPCGPADHQYIINLSCGRYEDGGVANITLYLCLTEGQQDIDPLDMAIVIRGIIREAFDVFPRRSVKLTPKEFFEYLFRATWDGFDYDSYEMFEKMGLSWQIFKNVPVSRIYHLSAMNDFVADNPEDEEWMFSDENIQKGLTKELFSFVDVSPKKDK